MASTRTPAKHFAPLAIGAPEPFRTLPVNLERMIHFVPPHNEKIRAKIKDLAAQVDVVLGNLEDAVPLDQKENARKGFIQMLRDNDEVRWHVAENAIPFFARNRFEADSGFFFYLQIGDVDGDAICVAEVAAEPAPPVCVTADAVIDMHSGKRKRYLLGQHDQDVQ